MGNKAFVIIGVVFILIGLVFNEWVITNLFNPIGLVTYQLKVIILIFDILCVLTGFLLIRFRSRIKGREVLLSLATLAIFLLFMEGGVRLFYFIKYKIVERERSYSEYLGWEIVPDVHSDRTIKGYGKVSYSTGKYGFRTFGDTGSNNKKVLVIGDSVTQGYTVSDGNTYYNYLKKRAGNIEIFAYGCGGYSSLQEYMILDKYFDLIKPDIVLWQFSSNDIINNDHDLESGSFYNNNHMIRPYLIDGEIKWLYPMQQGGWIYSAVQHSYLLRFINIRLNIFKAAHFGSIEDKLSEDHPLLKRSAQTTSEIMRMVRKRVGDIPIIAFTADNPKWSGTIFEDISRRHQIHFISGIPESIEDTRKTGVPVDGRPYDGHWNATGHKIVGEAIFDYLLRSGLISDRKS